LESLEDYMPGEEFLKEDFNDDGDDLKESFFGIEV
jgi:hypothetical protein